MSEVEIASPVELALLDLPPADLWQLMLTANRRLNECKPLYRWLMLAAHAAVEDEPTEAWRPWAWHTVEVQRALGICGRWSIACRRQHFRLGRLLFDAISDSLLTELKERRVVE